jgi:hypothetical protein
VQVRKTSTVSLAALVAILASLGGLASGCGPSIQLSSDRYFPLFDPAPLADYRGRAIVMRSFENVDEQTTFYTYRGSGHRYGGPVLSSYFWYCFRNAFERLGVQVLEEGGSPAVAPVMAVRLVRINDASFIADVTLAAPDGRALQKRYAIAGPPVVSRARPDLEQRAYEMVSSLFWSIVASPEFRTIVTR